MRTAEFGRGTIRDKDAAVAIRDHDECPSGPERRLVGHRAEVRRQVMPS